MLSGGSARESNPPTPLVTRHNGFEVRKSHRAPSTPITFSIVDRELGPVVNRRGCKQKTPPGGGALSIYFLKEGLASEYGIYLLF